MFDGLIALALRNRLLVLVFAAVLLAYGGWTAAHLPVDVFPDLNRPTVTLLTECGGLSPEEVEQLVTRPVETAMNGAPGVATVRSQSAIGLSVIWVEFDDAVDVYRARQQVAERVAEVQARLPTGVTPELGPVSSIMGEILLVGVTADDGPDGVPVVDGPALRALADTVVRPRLLAIPGVSQSIPIGGGREQIHVDVHPDRLAALGIPLADVRAAAGAAQGSTSGGFLERKSQEYVVRNLARTADPARIAEAVVATRGGVPIPLGDVADVTRGVGPMRGDAGVNGRAAVILNVEKQPGADTIALTEAVGHALDELGRGLPAGVHLVPLFRQADFIQAAVDNVEEALRDGAILVTVILVLFLLDARTTVISLTAIPLSLVVAALTLRAFGLTVNTMTLGGLAVAIGELVDDAIVDVENVHRRLRDNARLAAPRPALRVVFEASREVRGSIVFSTALVLLVFLPLFQLSGMEGRLFAPLGVAYVASILGSMLVSLTVTPALCAWLLPGAASRSAERGDGWLVRHLKALQRRVLTAALPHPGLVLGGAMLAVAVAVASLPLLGTSFLPPFNEGTATVNLQAAPGTSLAESDRLGTLAERQLLTIPEVASTGRRTGRAELDEHAEGVHYTEMDVDFRPGRPRAEVLADMRAKLAVLPGLSVNLGQPISHRLDHLLSGVRAQIAVKLFGPDLAVLRAEAARLQAALAPIPGLVDLSVERQVLVPQVRVDIDPAAAKRFGVPPGALADDLATALGGTTVGQALDGDRNLDVVVRYASSARQDVDDLGSAPVTLPDGRAVTLGQLADISTGTGPNQILHEDGQRRIALSANTAGRDVGGVVADIQAVLATWTLPPGAHVEVGGQFERQQAATRTIGVLSLGSLFAMYALLYAHFRSHALTAQILLNIPLALIGAVAAIWIVGEPLSVATMVGFVTLSGIATRNTILLISHYVHLAREEGEAFGPAMVMRGSLERLVPVTMTALCAGIGLVPLALAGGEPGKEVLAPVAQVVLGGLFSSTLLDLVVTPTVFLRFGGPGLRALLSAGPDPLESP